MVFLALLQSNNILTHNIPEEHYWFSFTYPCANRATIFFVRCNPSAGSEAKARNQAVPTLTFKVNALKQLLITPAVKTRFSFFRVQNLILIVGLGILPTAPVGAACKDSSPGSPTKR